MRFSFTGLLKLKPFDESDDAKRETELFATNNLLALGVLASFLLALCALGLTLTGSHLAWFALSSAAAVSAITAGLEWNAGLHARALNQLFITVIVVIGITLQGVW